MAVRIRVPQGRSVRSVSLLKAAHDLKPAVRQGWIDVTVTRVFIHEAVLVDLV